MLDRVAPEQLSLVLLERAGAQSIRSGRLARPTPESSREAALLGETSKECHFGETVVSFAE